MNAHEKDLSLATKLHQLANPGQMSTGFFPVDERFMEAAHTLRLAGATLHRWSADVKEGTIKRKGPDGTGVPYTLVNKKHNDVPDLEAGALDRVEKTCNDIGLHFYKDPDGIVYLAKYDMTENNYASGLNLLGE